MERLIKQLASLPFARDWADKDECLTRLQTEVRLHAHLFSFTLKKVKKGKKGGGGFIETVSFARKNTKKLQEATVVMVNAVFNVTRDAETGAVQVAPERREAYDHWVGVFEEYVAGVNLLRIKPNFDRDHSEFQQKANAAAAAFQKRADAFGAHLLHPSIAFDGDKVIANYVHDILAGHVADLIRKWGCVSLFSNDGSEAKNQDIICIFRRHSQQGGWGGGQLKSKSDAGMRWAMRMIYRLCGYDKVVEAEWHAGEKKRKERLHLKELNEAKKRQRTDDAWQATRAEEARLEEGGLVTAEMDETEGGVAGQDGPDDMLEVEGDEEEEEDEGGWDEEEEGAYAMPMEEEEEEEEVDVMEEEEE